MVLDNCNVDMKNLIYELFKPYCVLVFFLPPYSYDFSPSELSFFVAKANMKSQRGLEPPYHRDAAEDFKKCLLNISATIACHNFQKCGYEVMIEEQTWACAPEKM